MRGADDSALVAAAVSGDGAAYGELFGLYEKRIFNYAYGILGNREDACDVAQDAFVRVFEAMPGKDESLNFSAYLYRTTHNCAMNAIKHRGRFTSPEALDFEHDPALRADPEKVALLAEQQEQTWRATAGLADNHRAILALRELHDMSYQEIADVMEMPRNTVGVLLSRARIKFKEAFRMSSVDIEKIAEECKEMLPLLSGYIDEELTATERERVESHLKECAFCQLALEEMTEASKSYRALLPLLPPASLNEGVRAKLSDLLSPDEAYALEHSWESAGRAGKIAGASEASADATPTTAPRGRSWTRRALLVAAGAVVISLVGALSLGVFAPETQTANTAAPTIGLPVDPEASDKVAGASDTSESVETATELQEMEEPELPTEDDPSGSDTPSDTPLTPADPADTPAPDTTAPPTPTQVSPADSTFANSDSTLVLTWEPVTDESGVTYSVELERYDADSEAYVAWKTITGLTEPTLTYRTGLDPERWRVWAVDGEENESAKTGWWRIGKMMLLLPLPEIDTPPMIY